MKSENNAHGDAAYDDADYAVGHEHCVVSYIFFEGESEVQEENKQEVLVLKSLTSAILRRRRLNILVSMFLLPSLADK